MAPITTASANLAYDKASTKLKRACTQLEYNIPPCDTEGLDLVTPPLRPRERSDPLTPCAQCATELEELEEGARADHICTHRRQDDDAASNAGSEGDRNERNTLNNRRARQKQPKLGVVKEYLSQLDICLDAFTDAVSVLCSTLTVQNEKDMYQDHLFVWVEHCEALKNRARDTIEVLEAALHGGQQTQPVSTAAAITTQQ